MDYQDFTIDIRSAEGGRFEARVVRIISNHNQTLFDSGRIIMNHNQTVVRR